MKSKKLTIFISQVITVLYYLGLTGPWAIAETRENRLELEAGIFSTKTMDLHGYQQPNATKNWDSAAPTIRLEAWSIKSSGWNFGGALQPLYLKYNDTLSSDWTAKGKDFKQGDEAKLTYQFHSVRGTANYPVWLSEKQDSYLRLGASVILRYADIRFSSNNQSYHGTNFIAVPLINIEGNAAINEKYSFFTRSDFLPSPTGDVFLEGLYDLFFGLRRKTDTGNYFDAGLRLFFGGYDPDRQNDFGNRIFFQGIVIKYGF